MQRPINKCEKRLFFFLLSPSFKGSIPIVVVGSSSGVQAVTRIGAAWKRGALNSDADTHNLMEQAKPHEDAVVSAVAATSAAPRAGWTVEVGQVGP